MPKTDISLQELAGIESLLGHPEHEQLLMQRVSKLSHETIKEYYYACIQYQKLENKVWSGNTTRLSIDDLSLLKKSMPQKTRSHSLQNKHVATQALNVIQQKIIEDQIKPAIDKLHKLKTTNR